MQNIHTSISFHSKNQNHENTKHMQTRKLKTVVNTKKTLGFNLGFVITPNP